VNIICFCAAGCGSNPMADPGVWPECNCWCHDKARKDQPQEGGMGAGTEGWGVMRPDGRRYHYYRETMSLCRAGFYRGELPLDTSGPTPQDCAACRKVLAREKAQAHS